MNTGKEKEKKNHPKVPPARTPSQAEGERETVDQDLRQREKDKSSAA